MSNFPTKAFFGENYLNDPISDIDLSYTEEDGITRLSVILNAIETIQEDIKSNQPYTADISVQGVIHWANEQSNSWSDEGQKKGPAINARP